MRKPAAMHTCKSLMAAGLPPSTALPPPWPGLQIFDELRKIGKRHDLSAGLLIGGKDVKEEQDRVHGASRGGKPCREQLRRWRKPPCPDPSAAAPPLNRKLDSTPIPSPLIPALSPCPVLLPFPPPPVSAAGMNILVCTPGRLLQHMDESPGFDAGQLQVLVLDEADRILDMVSG